MADLKISQLTAITTLTPATDVLPVVDVTGTTKKITTNQLLGSGGTATLASATITGDLTVRTNKLAVTSTGVGIGTASPSATFDIRRNASGSAFLSYHNGGNGTVTSGADLNEIRCDDTTTSYNLLNLNVVGSARFVVASNGVCTWSNVGGVAGTAMTLNSTGLGVGGSPSAKLDVNSASITDTDLKYNLIVRSSDSYTTSPKSGIAFASFFNGSSNLPLCGIFGGKENGTINDFASAVYIATRSNGGNITTRLTIDSSGNVGVGVTPSAGKGCLQLSSGINFPATQVASSDANTLDDYVETTFNPTIVGSSIAGSATYSTQVGRATKVGRLVTFQLRVAYSAGTGTGNLRVGGLPFTAGVGSVFTIYAENIALTASNYAVASLSSGNTFISVDQLPTGGGAATAVAYDAAGDIQISGSYIV